MEIWSVYCETDPRVRLLSQLLIVPSEVQEHEMRSYKNTYHYSDVIMIATASQITGVSIASSTACSSADRRKHRSSASQRTSDTENVTIRWRHRVNRAQWKLKSKNVTCDLFPNPPPMKSQRGFLKKTMKVTQHTLLSATVNQPQGDTNKKSIIFCTTTVDYRIGWCNELPLRFYKVTGVGRKQFCRAQ